jgi:alpha-D-ribose 1-methylphosphonate 5-triphosphate synthase subunit PhnL
MNKNIGDTINALFAKPKPATIEHFGEKIEIFIKSFDENTWKEYNRLLGESDTDSSPAIRYLFFNYIVDDQNQPIWDSPESIKLNPEFRKNVLDIISETLFNTKISEFAAKNFPGSPSLEVVSK